MNNPEHPLMERVSKFFQPVRPLLSALNEQKQEILDMSLLAIGLIAAPTLGVWWYGQNSESEMIQNTVPQIALLMTAGVAISVSLGYYFTRGSRF